MRIEGSAISPFSDACIKHMHYPIEGCIIMFFLFVCF